jgi:HEAT repeat protein
MKQYLALAMVLALGIPQVTPNDSLSVTILFKQLQQPSSTDQAAAELARMGPADTNTKSFLAKHLLDIIGKPPTNRYVWLNSVRLAGRFRLTEAIPVLGENIRAATEESSQGGLTSRYQLVGFPCGKALVEIGEPSIPELTKILNSGDLSRQWIAYRALFLIGTPRAMTALRERLANEPNEAFKSEIKTALSNYQPPSPP